jgi:hypothetical protein
LCEYFFVIFLDRYNLPVFQSAGQGYAARREAKELSKREKDDERRQQQKSNKRYRHVDMDMEFMDDDFDNKPVCV